MKICHYCENNERAYTFAAKPICHVCKHKLDRVTTSAPLHILNGEALEQYAKFAIKVFDRVALPDLS
ncbi:MAG: hypothetical protein K0S39_4024 [Paenibacillus sp.]|jgi:hypothetical protein|nr:hypothetical protein [Paenibacillus sp.]